MHGCTFDSAPSLSNSARPACRTSTTDPKVSHLSGSPKSCENPAARRYAPLAGLQSIEKEVNGSPWSPRTLSPRPNTCGPRSVFVPNVPANMIEEEAQPRTGEELADESKPGASLGPCLHGLQKRWHCKHLIIVSSFVVHEAAHAIILLHDNGRNPHRMKTKQPVCTTYFLVDTGWPHQYSCCRMR